MTQNRIDHVVIAVRPESFEACHDKWERVLGLDFEYAEREDMGVRIYADWQAGIEVLAPIDRNSPLWAQLEAHGEGVMGIVLGVPNIDEAKEKARMFGIGYSPDLGLSGTEPWADRFERMRQSSLDPMFGVLFILSESKYK